MLHRSLHTPASWAVVVLAAAAIACGAPDQAADPAGTQVSLRLEDIVVAQAESLSAGPLISGSLMPDRQATLRAEVPGTVVEVLVEPGQSVRAGQLLARLDDVALAEA
ncbi:MAG: biotin/lipoyl-binding protein, partial [Gemmatimonadota bacterium]